MRLCSRRRTVLSVVAVEIVFRWRAWRSGRRLWRVRRHRCPGAQHLDPSAANADTPSAAAGASPSCVSPKRRQCAGRLPRPELPANAVDRIDHVGWALAIVLQKRSSRRLRAVPDAVFASTDQNDLKWTLLAGLRKANMTAIDRPRCGTRRSRAVRHLQPLAHRAGDWGLSGDTVAAGAADRALRTPGGVVTERKAWECGRS